MTPLEILDELSIPYKQAGEHEHVTEGWVGLDCPTCSPGTGWFRLGWKLDGGWMSCWVCGGRPVTATLAELSGRAYREVESLVGCTDRIHSSQTTTRPKGKLVLPKGLQPLLPAHKSYLEKRGFDPDRLERQWGLKGIGLTANLAWRIWIPVIWRGRTVSWTTRAISDGGRMKYVNAKKEEEELPAKSLLFGSDHARGAIVVVEGPLDAMRIGFGSVATMGVSYTREQMLQIAMFPVRAICFDSEPMAQTRAKRLCSEVGCFPGKTYRIEMETGKDPGEASEREIKRVRERFLD